MLPVPREIDLGCDVGSKTDLYMGVFSATPCAPRLPKRDDHAHGRPADNAEWNLDPSCPSTIDTPRQTGPITRHRHGLARRVHAKDAQTTIENQAALLVVLFSHVGQAAFRPSGTPRATLPCGREEKLDILYAPTPEA